MGELTAIQEGDSDPSEVQPTALDYIGAVLAFVVAGAIICAHVGALIYLLRPASKDDGSNTKRQPSEHKGMNMSKA